MCNVFISKVQLAFGNEEGIVSLCLNDDTTQNKCSVPAHGRQLDARGLPQKGEGGGGGLRG